jgi:hypothetical protein
LGVGNSGGLHLRFDPFLTSITRATQDDKDAREAVYRQYAQEFEAQMARRASVTANPP